MKTWIVYWYERFQDSAVIERGFESMEEAKSRANEVTKSLRTQVYIEEEQ